MFLDYIEYYIDDCIAVYKLSRLNCFWTLKSMESETDQRLT